MKTEGIICDCCGKTILSQKLLHWEQQPSVFSLAFPRDSINGGIWNMDVCVTCRHALFDAIHSTIVGLRVGTNPETDTVAT